MNKYQPLREFLESKQEDEVNMTFKELEEIIGSPLPPAKKHRAFFANDPAHSIAKAWMDAGFVSQRVDVRTGCLSFVRDTGLTFYSAEILKEFLAKKRPLKNAAITIPALELVLEDFPRSTKEVISYLTANKVELYGPNHEKIDIELWWSKGCNAALPYFISAWNGVFYALSEALLYAISPDAFDIETFVDSLDSIGIIRCFMASDHASFAIPFAKLYKEMYKKPLTREVQDSLPALAKKADEQLKWLNVTYLEQAYLRQMLSCCLETAGDAFLSIPFNLFAEMMDIHIVWNIEKATYATRRRFGVAFLVGDAGSRFKIYDGD